MKRRVFNILAAVSLVLAVAVPGCWARSYSTSDILVLRIGSFAIDLYTRPSGIGVIWTWVTPSAPAVGWKSWASSSAGAVRWAHIPISYFEQIIWPSIDNREYFSRSNLVLFKLSEVSGGTVLVAPMWALMLPASLTIAFWIWRRHKWRRRHLVCATCGYDLRASKDKCPECGAGIPTKE